MSTDSGMAAAPVPGSRRAATRRRRARGFLVAFAAVVVALATVGAAAAGVGTLQGPRVTQTRVDPAAAAAASGARLLLTTTQSLDAVEANQVTIEPDVPFAVDTSGRTVGVRFTQALWDDTTYTVTVRDVTGAGGGAAATLETSFRTPPAEVYLLQRGADGDTIFRTDLAGQQPVAVFTHDHIEDFRATATRLVVSVRMDDDTSQLIITDLDGADARTLPLPDTGDVDALQSADRGDLIGFTFTDADIGAGGTDEATLYTISLSDPDAKPRALHISGAESRVAQWRFVPDTDSILLASFDGTLWLTDPTGADATNLGTAAGIDGIAGTTAIVENADGVATVDLSSGAVAPLVAADVPGRVLRAAVPIPGGGTVRLSGVLDAAGLPTSTLVTAVADDGGATTVFTSPAGDAVFRLCVAPSGRYAAVLVAPDVVDNPYDGYRLPLPERLETNIVDLSTGDEVVALSGFDISWCRVPPQ